VALAAMFGERSRECEGSDGVAGALAWAWSARRLRAKGRSRVQLWVCPDVCT